MVALYVFLLIVAAVGALGYIFLFFSHVPGAKAERLGVLEPLPQDLGKWVRMEPDSGEDFVKERRYLLSDPSKSDSNKVVIQIRYLDPETSEIVRILPETVYRRKRIRQNG